MKILKAIASFYLIIMAVVIPHEFAHLVFMKNFGVPVQEASLGFGSLLATISKGGTNYSLRAIPLGGYVLPREEINLPFFPYLLILASGGVVNILLGISLKKIWARGSDYMRGTGVLNLLPIPLLDGGKILVLILMTLGIGEAVSHLITLATGSIIVGMWLAGWLSLARSRK